MFFIGVVYFFVAFQWLSIWASVAKIDKNKKEQRNKLFKHLFCTVGIPAILSLIISIPLLCFLDYSWLSCIALIALDIIFGTYGGVLERKLFNKKNKKRIK